MGKEFTEESTGVASMSPPGLALHRLLFVVSECGRPSAGGMRIALSECDDVVLGRGEKRRVERLRTAGRRVIRIDIPDKRMSVEHARITLGAGAVTLSDLGSTNGTFLDGERIENATIKEGKAFVLGQTLFQFATVEASVTFRSTDFDCESAAEALPGLMTLDPLHAPSLERLKRVAASGVPIMLLGETGTGKEVLAHAVHAISRRPGPFVAVNCGAIPASLVESQLFGHMKGAFSGAVRDEPGIVRGAQFGTLFLDEIGDLPAPSQAALLRVLQEGEVMPVGATRTVAVDLRVVCATHQPLEDLMDRGTFRRDLYARLAGFAHTLPPLRERRVDLGILMAALLRGPKVVRGEALRVHVDAALAMLRYDWPLNVRELEQCLVTSSVLAEGDVVRVEDLPPSVGVGTPPVSSDSDVGEAADRDEAIRRELLLRLVEHRGNLAEVARGMGKARQQIQRWAKRFGIDPDAFRERR